MVVKKLYDRSSHNKFFELYITASNTVAMPVKLLSSLFCKNRVSVFFGTTSFFLVSTFVSSALLFPPRFLFAYKDTLWFINMAVIACCYGALMTFSFGAVSFCSSCKFSRSWFAPPFSFWCVMYKQFCNRTYFFLLFFIIWLNDWLTFTTWSLCFFSQLCENALRLLKTYTRWSRF